jgi:hypothetical protein
MRRQVGGPQYYHTMGVVLKSSPMPPRGSYVFVDVDAEGVPIGLELLFAGRTLAADDVTSVTVNIGLQLQPA